jgi:hypothetical protein
VIYDNDRGPRPIPPFIALEFIGSATLGSPEYSLVKTEGTDDGEQQIRQQVRKSLTMHAFGEGAIDLLETIKASISMQRYIEMLALKGLVIPEALEVTENPSVRDNETENGAFFDFYITYTRVITDVPGWIETVGFHSENLPMRDITNREGN